MNDAPVAVADAATVDEGATVTVLTTGGGNTSVLDNDSDSDVPADTLTAVLDTDVSNGSLTLNANGTFSYTHDGGETTSDSFTYHVNDGSGAGNADSNIVTVAITVNSVNDVPVFGSDPWNFSVDENVSGATVDTVSATDVDVPAQTLTYSISGADAASFAIDGSTGEITTAVALDFETQASYAFTVTVTDNGTGTLTDTATVNVNVNNIQEYTLTIDWLGTGTGQVDAAGDTLGTNSPFPGGSTSGPSGTTVSYLCQSGDIIQLTAIDGLGPAPGSIFKSWSANVSTAVDVTPTTITMDADKSVSVTFNQRWEITLTESGDTANGITDPVSPYSEILEEGSDSSLFTITPDAGWYFDLWDNAAVVLSFSIEKTYQLFNVTENHTLVANFLRNPQVTSSVGPNGAIAPLSPPPNSVFYGDSITYTITPDEDYCIDDILIDSASIGTAAILAAQASLEVTVSNVTTDRTIHVTFREPYVFMGKIEPFRAREHLGGAGKWRLLDHTTGSTTESYNHQDTVEIPCASADFDFETVPAAGWTAVQPTISFTAPNTLELTAEYQPNVTVTSTAGGAVTPLDGGASQAYTFNSQVTLTATPGSGYVFGWWEGGAEGDLDAVTITVNEPKTVHAVFVTETAANVDNDGDGYTENGGDCNDGDATIHPGAAETCEDGIDQDCNGSDLPCDLTTQCMDLDDYPIDTQLQAAPANVMFAVDDSGSMNWEFMTPEADGLYHGGSNWNYYLSDLDSDERLQYKSQWSGYNRIYYNPNTDFEPWPNYLAANPNTPSKNPTVPATTTNMSGVFHSFGGASGGASGVPDEPVADTVAVIVDDLDGTAGAGGTGLEKIIESDDKNGDNRFYDNDDFWPWPDYWGTSDYNDEAYYGTPLWDDDYRHTKSGAPTDGSVYGRWHFDNMGGGEDFDSSNDYEVYIWWPDSDYYTDNADYKIFDDGTEVASFTGISQENGTGAGWKKIGESPFTPHSGTFNFSSEPTSGVDVYVYNKDSDFTIADTVKIVRLGTPPTPATGRRFEIVQGTWRQESNNGDSYDDPTNGRHFFDTNNGTTVDYEARWYPHLPSGGDWKVYAWWRDTGTYSPNVTYTIHHQGGDSTRIVNQTANSGQWNLLDTFTFDGGATDDEYVKLFHNPSDNSDAHACADVVAFVKDTGAAVPTGTPVTDIVNAHYYVKSPVDNQIYLVNMDGALKYYKFTPDSGGDESVSQTELGLNLPHDEAAAAGIIPAGESSTTASAAGTAADTSLAVVELETVPAIGTLFTIDGDTAASSAAGTTGDTTLGVASMDVIPDDDTPFTIEGHGTVYKVAAGTTLTNLVFTPGLELDTPSGADISFYRTYTVAGGTTATNLVFTPGLWRNTPDGVSLSFPRTYAEERQNFANWFSYYRKRSLAAKAAIGLTLVGLKGAQVGVYSINNNVSQPVLKVKVGNNPDMTDTLLDIVYDIPASGGTPLRAALRSVGRYYDQEDGLDGNLQADEATHTGNPWYDNNNGGNCQQSFTILMTDGFYNGTYSGVGDADTLKGPPYQDHPTNDLITRSNTLADVAMKYFDDDLCNDVDNQVPTSFLDSNNRQHMVTYTVSFGMNGTLDPDNYDLYNSVPADRVYPIWPVPVEGTATVIDDMWHAAVNGRGAFLTAADPGELVEALQDVLRNLLARIGSGASVSINGEELHAGTVMFQASYSTDGWVGDVLAYNVNTVTGEVVRDTPVWSASYMLGDNLAQANPAWDPPGWDKTNWDTGRVIATYDPVAKVGKAFRFSGLTEFQKDFLDSDDAEVLKKINYLRGDNSNEEKNGGDFRDRFSKIGDLVHSSPLYHSHTVSGSTFGVLYVGGNDGMLHAFDADDGKELFAFVPSQVYPRLNNLTQPAYFHKFFVDLTPFVRDTPSGTFVVGGLGKGGKGYYALDVSDPKNHTEGDLSWVKWEYPRNDTPATESNHLGFTYSRAFIVRSNDASHPWVVIFSNGYDSNNQCAMLFVLDLFTGELVELLTTTTAADCAGTCNGLTEPALVDLDANGTVDSVYAGDLLGNIWKFDLSEPDSTNWGSAYKAGAVPKPLFTAKGPTGTTQPITVAPSIMKHPDSNKNGFLILFGTGKYFHPNDFDDTSQQTLYGIWDYGDDTDEYLGTIGTRAVTDPGASLSSQAATVTLLQQTEIYFAETVTGSTTSLIRVLSDNAIFWNTEDDIDAGQEPNPSEISANHAGWFIDLPYSSGKERVIRKGLIREGRFVVITSIPKEAACAAGGDSIVHELDGATGGRLGFAVFDIDEDADVDAGDWIEIPNPKWGQAGEPETIWVVPTGIHFSTMMYPPVILRMPGGDTEMKYFSTAAGQIELVQEIAEGRGMYYWIHD